MIAAWTHSIIHSFILSFQMDDHDKQLHRCELLSDCIHRVGIHFDLHFPFGGMAAHLACVQQSGRPVDF
jgi:hypothetical protein